MDKIRIENLEVFANHGVFPEETKLGQKFLVSITLHVDTRNAGKTDDLSKSVNYGEVSHFATDFLRTHTYHLIETAAEQLAEAILYTYLPVREVTIAIKKPWAPIGLPLESVAVEITRKWHKVYLAVGSNMGDMETYIRRGIDAMSSLKDCRVKRVSELIVTKPYGVTEQENFLNGCLEIETLLLPLELLALLHEIEAAADRKRELRWGPRTLDLDIIFYDDEVIGLPELMVPHVDMANRSFVLKPLAEIAPYMIHPIYRKTVAQMLSELKEREKGNEKDHIV
jgi:dihydroneopterin aldolase/2-amino-4-hydroxy-6-hydroxymethyldihydropteridine diphosphokinase